MSAHTPGPGLHQALGALRDGYEAATARRLAELRRRVQAASRLGPWRARRQLARLAGPELAALGRQLLDDFGRDVERAARAILADALAPAGEGDGPGGAYAARVLASLSALPWPEPGEVALPAPQALPAALMGLVGGAAAGGAAALVSGYPLLPVALLGGLAAGWARYRLRARHEGRRLADAALGWIDRVEAYLRTARLHHLRRVARLLAEAVREAPRGGGPER